jgi:hypothetical protein
VAGEAGAGTRVRLGGSGDQPWASSVSVKVASELELEGGHRGWRAGRGGVELAGILGPLLKGVACLSATAPPPAKPRTATASAAVKIARPPHRQRRTSRMPRRDDKQDPQVPLVLLWATTRTAATL